MKLNSSCFISSPGCTNRA